MVNKILKEIDLHSIAAHTTKGNHFTDDLHQELCLYFLENKDRMIELYERSELKPYIYRVAFNTYHTDKFYKTFRRPLRDLEQEEGIEIDLMEIIDSAGLTGIERQWINVYLQHDCNKTWMESRTNICRKAITKNIKEILEKCRK